VKLFQIEEPDGSPVDPDAPGRAIGIDISGARAEVAVAIGGNAVLLADREGFERDLPIPPPSALPEEWRTVFEGARLRAERALAQPVTHAVLSVPAGFDPGGAAQLSAASEATGLVLLRIIGHDAIGMAADPSAAPPALAAAVLAEDLAPRPDAP
jgi:hypothetical protein